MTAETLRDDVRVGDIFLDDAYGRGCVPAHLARLIREWDRTRVGAVYLSLRPDGSLACLDGWHRVCAARTVEGEDTTLPARVYIDLTVQEEAGLFTSFNKDRKALKPGELFRSRLACGEPEAIAIDTIVRSAGLRVSLDGSPGAGMIQAVSALDSVYTRHGGSALRMVLNILKDAMGTGDGAIQGSVMQGLAEFLLRYRDECDVDRLQMVLSNTSNPKLIGMANYIRSVSLGADMRTALGQGILQLYNTGLRRNQLPEWKRFVYGPAGREAAQARMPKVHAALAAARERKTTS